ncbi:MAG: hypothetical protein ACOYD4_04320 [Solirubrobacterales bacterium]
MGDIQISIAALPVSVALLNAIDELEPERWTNDGTVNRLRALCEFRRRLEV